METIHHILKLGARSCGSWRSDLKKRQAFLYSTSLVAQSWRTTSQKLLWDLLEIWEEDAALRILESPVLGVFTTSCLAMKGAYGWHRKDYTPVSLTSTDRILRSLIGVQRLTLMDYVEEDSLDFEFLTLPRYSRLVYLLCNPVSLVTKSSLNYPPVPFQLSSLHLTSSQLDSPKPFTDLAVGPLRTFSLRDGGNPIENHHVTDLSRLLLTSSSTLESLDLVVHQNKILPRLLPTFPSFSILKRLCVVCSSHELFIIITTLTTSLDTLLVYIDPAVPSQVDIDLQNSARARCLPKCLDAVAHDRRARTNPDVLVDLVSDEVVRLYTERGSELKWKWTEH